MTGPPMDRKGQKDYLLSGDGMLKRIADWLEKVSVAAFAVGIFQGQFLWGLTVAVAALVGSLVITQKLER